MSLSEMIEVSRLEAKQGFVMPANAGIQVRFRCKFTSLLDSGFRRKDGIRVDFQSTNSEPLDLQVEGRSVRLQSGKE